MPNGISSELLHRLKDAIEATGCCDDYQKLTAIFTDNSIYHWKTQLPPASTSSDQINAVIEYLYKKEDKEGQNGLVLFLRALVAEVPAQDANHIKLVNLVKELREELNHTEIVMHREIDFVNRTQELTEIFQSNRNLPQQYWVIDAPAGYGKTTFLREVERRYQQQGWLCVYARLARETQPKIFDIANQIIRQLGTNITFNYETSIPSMGEQIAGRLLNYSIQNNGSLARSAYIGGTILIDNIETLDETTFLDLAHLVNAIHDYLRSTTFFDQHNRLRLFLAGRDARHRSAVFRSIRFPYRNLTLSPYAFPYVAETVQQYAQKAGATLKENVLSKLAADLMYLNGGHPGLIAGLLQQLAEKEFVGASDLLSQHCKGFIEQFDAIVETLINGNDTSVLIDILESLSVFRRFRPWLLQALIDENLINWSGDGEQLEEMLTKTYLLHREDGFLQDSITQRLFAIRLRLKNASSFEKLCQTGMQLYRNRLSETTPQYSAQLATEYVYLSLQYAYHVVHKQGPKLRQDVLDTLKQSIALLLKNQKRQDVLPDFLSLLEEDWELEFFFNYCTSDDHSYNSELYREILNDIKEEYGYRPQAL